MMLLIAGILFIVIPLVLIIAIASGAELIFFIIDVIIVVSIIKFILKLLSPFH